MLLDDEKKIATENIIKEDLTNLLRRVILLGDNPDVVVDDVAGIIYRRCAGRYN